MVTICSNVSLVFQTETELAKEKVGGFRERSMCQKCMCNHRLAVVPTSLHGAKVINVCSEDGDMSEFQFTLRQ